MVRPKSESRPGFIEPYCLHFHMVGAASGPRKTPEESNEFVSVASATIAVYVKTKLNRMHVPVALATDTKSHLQLGIRAGMSGHIMTLNLDGQPLPYAASFSPFEASSPKNPAIGWHSDPANHILAIYHMSLIYCALEPSGFCLAQPVRGSGIL